MSDSRFERLEELFHLTVDASGEERRRLLDPVRRSDPDLCAEVERLLARADARHDLSTLGSLVPPPNDIARSERALDFGPYRVVRRLGAGGMGVVYEAEQSEPIPRRVAVKVVPSALDSARVVARFQAERRTLARMSHPSIALVLDAGETSDGRPYFVMEYVEGEAITDYCDRERLDVRARIGLFSEVCDAVQHAHQKGIVHRDLKPSNVLISRADGGALPKVIDFGIARVIDAPEESDRLTRAGELVGTPAYMSPEQSRGDAHDVDTRADVYSLGVLLYELLTGQLPFAGESMADRSDPPRPSQRVTPPDETTTWIAARRRSTPRVLGSQLRGDLDWVTLKALAEDRERRYASAAALRDDLLRHLRHEAVEAGPPGAAYRAGRFVRRHRAGIAAAALVVLALLAGIVGTTVGLLRAREAERAARADAATAERVSGFLVDLFDVSKPVESDGREVTAREILERGASRVREELSGEPAVQTRLLRTVGEVYSDLGLYPQARTELEDAVELARTLGGQGETELARSLVALGQLERRLENPAGAEAAYHEALAIQERVYGPDHATLGATLNELALLLKTSDPEEALRLYRRGHDLVVARYGPDHGDAGVLLANIGSIHLRAGRYEEARENLEEALGLLVKHHGENDPRTAGAVGNLALVHLNLGNYTRALELQQRDLELSSRVLGPDHPVIGQIYLSLSRTNQRLGDESRALEQAERALEIFSRQLAPSHSLRIIVENARAGLFIRAGRYDEARSVLEATIALSPQIAEARNARLRNVLALAELERLEGNLAGSIELAGRVLVDPTAANDDWLIRQSHWERAYALAAQGDSQAAADERRQALEHGGERTPSPGSVLYAEARYTACAGDPLGALDYLREAIEAGFRDAILLTDPTLAGLREHPEFAEITRSLRSR